MPIYFFDKEKKIRKKSRTLPEDEIKRFTSKFNEVAKKYLKEDYRGEAGTRSGKNGKQFREDY